MSSATESTTAQAPYLDFTSTSTTSFKRPGPDSHGESVDCARRLRVALLTYLFVFVLFDHWVVPGGFGYIPRLLMLAGLVLGLGLAGLEGDPSRALPGTSSTRRRNWRSPNPACRATSHLVDLQRAGRPVSPQIIATMQKRAADRSPRRTSMKPSTAGRCCGRRMPGAPCWR